MNYSIPRIDQVQRVIFLPFFIIFLSVSISAQRVSQILSPDKSIAVSVSLQNGQLYYTIHQNANPIIESSPLGIVMDEGHFADHLTISGISKPALIKDEYNTHNAKRSHNLYMANRVTVSCKNAQGKAMDVIFSVSNDGVAFRYYFPWIGDDMVTIEKEITAYRFHPSAKGWLQPMSEAKTGWEQCHPSYEEHYQQNIPAGTLPVRKAGWVYPALFQTKHAWVLITEAGLDGTYCGTRLVNDSGSSLYRVGFPDPREVFTGQGYLPKNNKPWFTPWRIICIGGLNTLIESTLGTDLSPKAITMDNSFVKPGKASWSWINSKDDFIIYDEQKRYIDFAAAMHWQYCLIDADWDTKIGYEKVRELSAYAASRNVGILLWYNSAGDWNTVKYHPKGLLLTKEGREKEFSRLQAMGIKGIKIDFFGGDGQSMIQYYIDILNDAARYQLLVNFHGATLPRGWQRTYPHLMTAEAIYGMEMVTFEQSAADAQASHCTVIPFTRNAFDPMDFTPMNLYKLTHAGAVRKTSSAFELALTVIFLSGIQHFAENPEGMKHVPSYAIQFLQDLPASWDDVKFLDGFPGKFVVLARKHGNKWYVAGINGENEAKQLTLDLSPLKKKGGTLITDTEGDTMFKQQSVTLGNSKSFNVEMKPNGGFVMVMDVD